MADKHPKRPRDFSQAAKLVVDIASGQVDDREPTPEEQGKDPAAVSLGRRGGLKGGPARSAKMTKEQRTAAARTAAKARWSKP
ncbi:MAG: histone H1 [Methylocella sp.]